MLHHQLITRQLLRTHKSPIHTLQTTITTLQHFSTKPKKSKKEPTTTTLPLPQKQQQTKSTEKQKRTDKYNSKMERQMKLKYRRMTPEKIIKKDFVKNQFRAYFDKKRDWELIQDKLARKSGRFEKSEDAWLVKVAIAVERIPLVIPDPPDWEKDFLELKEYLDSFEQMYPEDTIFGKELNVDGEGMAVGALAKSERSFWKSITQNHELLPRITEADETNDIQSLNRKLDSKLFLITPETIQDDEYKSTNKYNVFPTTAVKKDETLIDACKRVVREKCGEDLILYCPANSPMAVNVYLHDHDVSPYWGEKIFLFRCHRDIGDVDQDVIGGKDNYAWLNREEIVEKVKGVNGEFASKMYHYLL